MELKEVPSDFHSNLMATISQQSRVVKNTPPVISKWKTTYWKPALSVATLFLVLSSSIYLLHSNFSSADKGREEIALTSMEELYDGGSEGTYAMPQASALESEAYGLLDENTFLPKISVADSPIVPDTNDIEILVSDFSSTSQQLQDLLPFIPVTYEKNTSEEMCAIFYVNTLEELDLFLATLFTIDETYAYSTSPSYIEGTVSRIILKKR